jgi:serine/threonine protein phosphatase 1
MEINDIQQKSSSPPWEGKGFSRPIGHRRFAVGDVHGCSKTLRALVEEKISLTTDDTLYLLGDYIDRGPDSKGVLDYLLDLRNSNYDIRPLRGNHEQLLLDSVSDPGAQRLWYNNGGWGTQHEFGVTSAAEIPQLYRDFLALLPHLFVTDDYVLTHAGLDFNAPDPIHDTSDYDLLWIRDSNIQPAKLGGRTLVCGHTMTPLFAIEKSLYSSVIYLDNGCFDKGQSCYGSLVALNLDSRELLVQENIE